MDADRFDALTRTLTILGSRRHALGALLAGVPGLLGLLHGFEPEAAIAHNPLKKCKKKSGKAKKKYIVSSTSCPKGGWKFGGNLIFATDRVDGTPAPADETRQATIKCKK